MSARVLNPSRAPSRAVERELRLFPSITSKLGALVLLLVVVVVPLSLTNPFYLSLMTFAGIAAIGTVGLNLLFGYAGELSIGHAFFIGVGTYTGVFLGHHRGLPLIIWVAGAAAVGALAGAIVAPTALRLRGPFLIIVTLGLVFLGQYIFRNWRSLTGGPAGTAADLSLALGPLDFEAIRIGSTIYNRAQGLCLLVWLLALAATLLVRNITRARAGRAMMAVRENEQAAQSLGIQLFRTKTAAFVVSSAITAVAGALFGAQLQFVLPESFNLAMSIQYIAILVIGGTRTTFGPILGALVLGALPQFADRFAGPVPFIHADPNASGFGLSVAEFTIFMYGFVLVFFLVLDPYGVVGVGRRLRSAFERVASSRFR